MSAFPNTGRSDHQILIEIRVRFRPIADVKIGGNSLIIGSANGQKRAYKKDRAEYQMKMGLKSPGALSAFLSVKQQSGHSFQ